MFPLFRIKFIQETNCTEFHQNNPSFIEDITKTVWSLFFRT